MKIEDATLVKYNANSRGTSTGDCTARAISLAFNMDYSKTRKLMNHTAKAYNEGNHWRTDRTYNNINNCKAVIKSLGGGDAIDPVRKLSVGAFADMHPEGTYLIWCSKDGSKFTSQHLVCIIDSKIYDSWDSRVYFVLAYWEIGSSGVKSSDITDVGLYLRTWVTRWDAKGYQDYTNNVFQNIIDKNRKLKKLVTEYGFSYTLEIIVKRVVLENFTFKFGCVITLNIPEFQVSDEYFKCNFAIVFKPTMSTDDVDKYFEESFYSKLYSFIQNNVIYRIEDICTSYDSIRDNPNRNDYQVDPWDTITKKSFKSLPYWVQQLTRYFSVQNPFEGSYHDSVRLDLYVPSFDPNPEGDRFRYFRAYNMADLKEGLDYYKKTGDYEKAYEIAADY